MIQPGDSNELYLVVSRGSACVKIHQVQLGDTFIGRSNSCDLILSDLLVSRVHAVVSKTNQTARLCDLKSRNGTRMDGQIIAEAELLPDSSIEIGPYELRNVSDRETALELWGSSELTTERFPPGCDQRTVAHRLTLMQQRIYEGFLKGLSEKELANATGLSVHTVHGHAKDLYKIFSVCSRAELLAQTLSSHHPKQ